LDRGLGGGGGVDSTGGSGEVVSVMFDDVFNFFSCERVTMRKLIFGDDNTFWGCGTYFGEEGAGVDSPSISNSTSSYMNFIFSSNFGGDVSSSFGRDSSFSSFEGSWGGGERVG
jgi:hypothetical protein